MSASAKTSVMNQCLIRVSALPLERYRLPDDGRKWTRARNRQSVLNFLARFANDDGTFLRRATNYSPGELRLMKHFHFSRQWVEILLDDLHQLGFLNWTRANRQAQREYTVIVSDSDGKDSPNCDANYSNPDDNDSSPNPVLTTTIQPLTTIIGGSDDKSGVVVSVLPSKEPREREPSAGQNLSRSRFLETAKAPRIVDQNDVDAVGAEFSRLMEQYGTKYKDPKDGVSSGWGKPVSRDDIEKMLQRCSQDEIVSALQNTFAGAADDQAIKYIEKNFFAKQGGVALVVRQRQKEWLANIQEYIDAVDVHELPETDLDDFLRDTPVPAGIGLARWNLINDAKRNWNRLGAAKYPQCGNCYKRGGALVNGVCEDCRSEARQ
jgi:hypothetical protein